MSERTDLRIVLWLAALIFVWCVWLAQIQPNPHMTDPSYDPSNATPYVNTKETP